MIPPQILTFLAYIPIVLASLFVYWLLFWYLPTGFRTTFEGSEDIKDWYKAAAWMHGIVIAVIIVVLSWYYFCHKEEYETKYQQFQQQQQSLNQ